MKTTITVGSSWHLFKEHLWRNPEMTGTGSLRGGLTTRAEQCKEPFFPALCPHCTPMTSLGKAASASGNSSPRNIPATHNQNYQAPSPTQQPTPPLKWKLKPRAFWLCDEGADKQRQPWFPGRGDRNEGSNAWLGRSDVWFSSAQVSPFAYLCTQGAGVFAEALATTGTGGSCSGSGQEMWSLTEASVPSPTLLQKRWSPHLFLSPSSPDSRKTGHNKWSRNWCYYLFVKLVVVLEAWNKLCF